VEMARDHERRPATGPLLLDDDIPDRIDTNALIAERLEPPLHLETARLLLERRRGDLTDRPLLLDGPGIVGPDDVQRRPNARRHRRIGLHRRVLTVSSGRESENERSGEVLAHDIHEEVRVQSNLAWDLASGL